MYRRLRLSGGSFANSRRQLGNEATAKRKGRPPSRSQLHALRQLDAGVDPDKSPSRGAHSAAHAEFIEFRIRPLPFYL